MLSNQMKRISSFQATMEKIKKQRQDSKGALGFKIQKEPRVSRHEMERTGFEPVGYVSENLANFCYKPLNHLSHVNINIRQYYKNQKITSIIRTKNITCSLLTSFTKNSFQFSSIGDGRCRFFELITNLCD